MTHLIRLFMILFCVATFTGCSGNPGGPEPVVPALNDNGQSHSDDAFVVYGKVVYSDLEGGFYTIEGNDGTTYDPTNLPETFQKDGLKVKATVRKRKDIASIHMRGTIIEISDISKQ